MSWLSFILGRGSKTPGLRQITGSIAVSMVGTGMWTSARVIYLARLGISPVQIGAGLLVAGLLGAALTVPVGNVLDGYAAKRGRREVTVVLLAAEGTFAALFALVDSFAAFIVVACAASAAERACAASAATLIGEMFGAAKVQCRASMQAAINLGLCLGGVLAAGALALNSLGALRAIAVANGASYLVACVLTSRLAGTSATDSTTPMAVEQGGRVPARYASFSCANALLSIHPALLVVALPLWIAQTHLAPAWIVGGAIFLNSALVGLWQLPATKRIKSSDDACRAASGSGVLLAASCVLIVAVGLVPSAARLPTLIAAIGIYTMAELAHAACAIYLSYALAEGSRLSSCQSFFSSSIGVSKAVGPLAAAAAVAAGPAGLIALGLGLLAASLGVTHTGREPCEHFPQPGASLEHRIATAAARRSPSHSTASSGVTGSLSPTI